MKKIMFTIIILLAITSNALAEQKWNPWTGDWETVPDNSNWRTRWNPWDNTWSYQPPDSKIEWNAWENTWDWNSGHGN